MERCLMNTYNDEIKVLNDLSYRYANILCHGGYGNNPNVLMISAKSTICNGYIKKVDVMFKGKDANGENQFDRFLYIDSEYGHEIKLPYEKIIAMDILSSADQAFLENYNRNKDEWNAQIERCNELKLTAKNEVSVEFINENIDMYKSLIKKGEELVAQGVKTFK